MCSNETLSQSFSSLQHKKLLLQLHVCIVVSREKRIFFSFVLSCLGIYERKLKIRPILVLDSSTFFWTVGLSELFWGPEKRNPSVTVSLFSYFLLLSLGIKIAAKNRGGGEKLPHTTMTHTLSVMNYAGTRRPTFSREIEFSSFKER